MTTTRRSPARRDPARGRASSRRRLGSGRFGSGRLGERGSFAVELAILGPVILAFLVMIIDGGRLTWARSRLQGAARDAARAVSINHNSGQGAYDAAFQAMTTALSNGGVDCGAPTLVLNPDPRTQAIGNDATVTATVSCNVTFVMAGTHTLTRSQQSVVDRYRQVTTGPAGGAGGAQP